MSLITFDIVDSLFGQQASLVYKRKSSSYKEIIHPTQLRFSQKTQILWPLRSRPAPDHSAARLLLSSLPLQRSSQKTWNLTCVTLSPTTTTSLVSDSVCLCRTVCTRVWHCSTPPSTLPGSKTPPLSCSSTKLTSWLTKSRPLTCRNTSPASQVSCWPAVYTEGWFKVELL